MKIFYFFFFLLWGYCGNLLHAQESLEDQIWSLTQFDVIQTDYLDRQIRSQIEQAGNSHILTVNQSQTGQICNSVFVQQLYNENRGYVDQKGSDLSTVLIQSGCQNEAYSWLFGESIRLTMLQQGDGNRIDSYIENGTGELINNVLIQSGTDNICNMTLLAGQHVADLLNGASVVVEQTGIGNQLELIIEGTSMLPVVITQLGSMVVSVKQSEFVLSQ